MKDETKEARTLEKALLSHVRSCRWILGRLRTLESTPPIDMIRVSLNETAVVMEHGVAHDPKSWHDLLGVYTSVKEKYDQAWADVELSRRKVAAGLEPPSGGPSDD